ncbi:MAG: arylamine N-acetyltransferase [Caldilineaceae bacterium]|nr:arylamine N-acetyltransferase [Caldilineaceae bacterium]
MEPSLPALEQLLTAYVRRVPWESVFRIAKRQRVPVLAERPRWPEEFWADALERGGGGTCFESNYAFLSLLRGLGYTGYLTVNNMGASIGCHTAIVVPLANQQRLVDVGIPLHTTLLLRPDAVTQAPSQFHTYIARPEGDNTYQIERTHHPKRYIYTLIDQPVPDAIYRAAMIQDYDEAGFFLDRLIITLVIDDKVWRFNGSEQPLRLEAFEREGKIEVLLPDLLLARRLATHFHMDRLTIQQALDALRA